jgi:hypothetical protein
MLRQRNLLRGIEATRYIKVALLGFGGHSVASPLEWLIRCAITRAS